MKNTKRHDLKRINDRIYTWIDPRSGKRIAAYLAFNTQTKALTIKDYLETYLPTAFVEIIIRSNQTFPDLPDTYFELEVVGASTKLVVCIYNQYQTAINLDCLPKE
jgi:hypothetical protein